VWDILSGGKLLHTCSNHQKTITCLAVDGTKTRLLSGGLDHHVKIYSLTTYQVRGCAHCTVYTAAAVTVVQAY
jgi:U3 small nucleolar RNA-associated protein 15